MDSGNILIAVSETSRYLKCLSLQIESGYSVISDRRNLRVLNLLNFQDPFNTSTIEKTVRNFLASPTGKIVSNFLA
jgi:hypothetical protein